jgi:hypothetical protein
MGTGIICILCILCSCHNENQLPGMFCSHVEQSAGLVKSSGATVAAAGGTSVVTAVSLARSLNMAGIIVSQTIAGQTIATINKGQTVVAPASFLQVYIIHLPVGQSMQLDIGLFSYLTRCTFYCSVICNSRTMFTIGCHSVMFMVAARTIFLTKITERTSLLFWQQMRN